MSDLHFQLRGYVESTIERVDLEDVVATVASGQTADRRPALRLRPAWVAAGAALLVVLLIGVPLVLFRGGESTTVDQPTTTTVPVTSTLVSTTEPVPPTTAPPETAAPLPGVPLAEAVPGFTDAIVMFTTERIHHVLRWEPSEPAPVIVVRAGGSPVGLDSSAGWLAEVQSPGDLRVYSVPTASGESTVSAIVASDVDQAIWHDTAAGQLTYLACPEPTSGTATLFTLDIKDPVAEPTRIRDFDQGCVEDLDGWPVGNVWLDRWNNEGVVASARDGDTFVQIRIGADGTAIPGDPGAAMIPDGPDGQETNADEIVTDGETLLYATWSPDGARLALLISTTNPDGPPGRLLRVVGATTGAILIETPDLDANTITGSPVWSSDSRFVVYHSWGQAADLAEGLDEEAGSASLGFYDTATGTTTIVPLDGFVDEIRIP